MDKLQGQKPTQKIKQPVLPQVADFVILQRPDKDVNSSELQDHPAAINSLQTIANYEDESLIDDGASKYLKLATLPPDSYTKKKNSLGAYLEDSQEQQEHDESLIELGELETIRQQLDQ